MSRSTLPKPKERDIQAGILEAAAALGIVLHPTDAGAYRAASGGRRGGSGVPKGWPDLSGYVTAKHRLAVPIFIEVKRPGERPRPEQQACLDRLNADGCLAAWFDDIGLAAAWLKATRESIQV